MVSLVRDWLIAAGALLLEYGLGGFRPEPRLAPIRARCAGECFRRRQPL